MSIKAMTMVWEGSKQSGSALLMLLAIADYAHDDGSGAWPSLETLARKTRMTRRNVIYVIQKLEAAGELRVRRNEGQYGSNVYDLLFSEESLVKPTSPGGCNPLHQASEADCTRVVNPISLGLVKPTSPNPSFDPLFNRHLTVREESDKQSLSSTTKTGDDRDR